ncbi:hypothetical protein SAHL_02655 [Salinisphaera orenii YIM 95161]|uniref:Uncharacterized protein n=2 Tax=Salinisphaera TaxID=180541 RepID=A0A423Q6B7_9GAMM|nr:hypothetical protein SAHL_02655 [Salinisphaera halophila YIM 95161]
MFWQRSNYFMVLNTAIAVGFFSVVPSPLAPLLALLGFFACISWALVTFGSKYWQSRWEEAARRLEADCCPKAKLFAASKDEVHEEVEHSLNRGNHHGTQAWMDERILKKPSVSFQMSMLALFFIGFWVLAFAVSLCMAGHA